MILFNLISNQNKSKNWTKGNLQIFKTKTSYKKIMMIELKLRKVNLLIHLIKNYKKYWIREKYKQSKSIKTKKIKKKMNFLKLMINIIKEWVIQKIQKD
jgi:hypothetical protein